MKKSFIVSAFALFATFASSAAFAQVDLATGKGFVGKGEVQLALGLNNAQVQTAALAFTIQSVTVTESTWTCDRDAGPQTSERANTTTTTTQGIVSSVARVKNQITGYNLNGFDGSPTAVTANEGPAVGSCPNGWTQINLVTGEPTMVSGGLYVNGVAL